MTTRRPLHDAAGVMRAEFSVEVAVGDGTVAEAAKLAAEAVEQVFAMARAEPKPPDAAPADPPAEKPAAEPVYVFPDVETGEALDLAVDAEFKQAMEAAFKKRKFSDDAAREARKYIGNRAKVSRLGELSPASRLSFLTELTSGQLDRFNGPQQGAA